MITTLGTILVAVGLVGGAVLARRAIVAAILRRDAEAAASARREHARWVAAEMARQVAREAREDRELCEAIRIGGLSIDSNGDA